MTDIQSNASFARGYYNANITFDSHQSTHIADTPSRGKNRGVDAFAKTDNAGKIGGEGIVKPYYSALENDKNINLLTKTAESFDWLGVVLTENKNSVLAYVKNVNDFAVNSKQQDEIAGSKAGNGQTTALLAGLKPFVFSGDRLIAFHSAMAQFNSALAQGCFNREPAALSLDGRPQPAGKEGVIAALSSFSPSVRRLAGLSGEPAVAASAGAPVIATAAYSADPSPALTADALAAAYGDMGYKEAWELLAHRTEGVKTGYLEVYETLVERYTGLFSDFSEFMGKLTNYLKVEPDKNGNQVMTFSDGALNDIQKLLNDYSGDKGILYPVEGSATRQDALAWANELGIDAKFVVPGKGGYVIKMDLGPLENIRDSLAENVGKGLSTFEYQSWRSGFDAQSDRMKTTLQTLTSKYGSANGMYDTVVKLLSTMIASCGDVLKQIMANF